MASFLQELDAIDSAPQGGFLSALDSIPDAQEVPSLPPDVSSNKSERWKAEQAADTERAAQFGLPPVQSNPEESDSRLRLKDAIQRTRDAGYQVDAFIGTDQEPEGDRAPTMDQENLVKALRQREQEAFAAGRTEEATQIARERAYWADNIQKSGMTAEEWKNQTGEDDPAYPQANVEKPNFWDQAFKSFARGATAEGIYAGAQGAASAAGQELESAAGRNESRPTEELEAELSGLREQVNVPRLGIAGPGMEAGISNQIADISRVLEARKSGQDPQTNRRSWQALASGLGNILQDYGDESGRLRESIREALPVEEDFARSLTGQVFQGLGQAGGTLPTYLIPGLGPAATVGQIYQQGVDDYANTMQQSGRPVDPADAHQVGLKNIPASALEVIGDKFILGKVLAPIKGKMTVGNFVKSIGLTAATEAGTEGAQQGWANFVAKTLANYDPERTLDDEVINSMIVGGIVGGGITGIGQSGAAILGRMSPSSDMLPPSPDPKVNEVETEIKLEADRLAPSSKIKSGLDQFIQTGEIQRPAATVQVEGDERFAPPNLETSEQQQEPTQTPITPPAPQPGGETTITPPLEESQAPSATPPSEVPTITEDAQQIPSPEAPNGGVQQPEIPQENAQLPTPQSREGVPTSGQTQVAPQRIQLSGPQTYEVIEQIPQTPREQELGEQFFRVKNERTGEEQIVEQKDMRAVRGRAVPQGPGASTATEWRARNFLRRFSQDERIDPETREVISESAQQYIPITNDDTIAQVEEKIAGNSLIQAASQAMDRTNDLTYAQRVTMGEVVLTRINEAIGRAKRRNDVTEAAELNDLAADLAFNIGDLGTELGRGIQAFTIWNRLTPQGLIATAERDVRRNGRPDGLTDTEKGELFPLAEAATKAPKGFLQNDAMRRFFTATARVKGIKAADLLTAYWYANILSGLNTQGINVFGSGISGLMNTISQTLVTNPVDSLQFFRGMAKASTGIAAQEGASAFISGSEANRLLRKFQVEPSALEALYTENPQGFKQRAGNAFSYGEYVFRALQAGDAFMYRTFGEGQAYLAASRAAREKGGSYGEMMMEELGMTAEMREAAVKQAEAEVEEFGNTKTPRQKKREVARRAFEIMESQRDQTIRTESDRFASLVTYTNEPEGLLGGLANSLNWVIRNTAIPTRYGDLQWIRPVIPFVNIIANVANSQLDFTPIGLVRAARGTDIMGKTQDSQQERIRRATNAVLGSAAAYLVWGLAQAQIDDEDPWFAIYADGPMDTERKRSLMSQGWKPYSMKFGDTYVKYNETPMSLVLATIGGTHDAQRYGASFNRKNLAEQAAYSATISMRALSEASFFGGMMEIVSILEGKSSISGFLSRWAKGLIPAQGLLRDISKSLNPEIVDKRQGEWANLVADIPVVKQFGTRPMLNTFGDPVKYSFFDRLPFAGRLFSERTDQPEWRYLAETGLRVSGVNRPIEFNAANMTKSQKRTLNSLFEDRAAVMGKYAAEIFTQDEEYEFVEKSGPRIKEAVRELRLNRSSMDLPDQQEWLDKRVREIRTQAKKDIMGL